VSSFNHFNQFHTRHVGLAAFLRYVLGDESHLSTEKSEKGIFFTFNDPDNKCAELETTFFSEESAVVGNARTLLDCSRQITFSMYEAKRNGSWEKSE
jgi:hypothetical protein